MANWCWIRSWLKNPLLAAERSGRVFRGTEIDPGYVDVAIERWEAMTGKRAA